jgi:cystathionine beta-lyase
VFALALAVKAFTNEGDSVLIQQPVYYPFSQVVKANKRILVNNPLVYENGRYCMNFEDFERKIRDNNVKLFLLCSPHNPVSRVWTSGELSVIGEICLRRNCIIVSDEIHCDFVYEGNKHIPIATISEKVLQNTVTCTAPSKTFNLAGLQISNIFIANEKLRREFKNEISKTGYSQLNTPGLAACKSAYLGGDVWLAKLIEYLKENLSFLREFLRENIPQIRLVEPDGTYLIWLDCKKLNLTQTELERFFLKQAKLWLDSGTMFGIEGAGFMRMNIACPREILERALYQLASAVNQINP